ncbi:MAG: hypothetical protein AAGB31_01795, partial [Bdellovibrio sp.]
LALVYKDGSMRNMKKIILVLLFACFFPDSLYAQSDVSWTGELDFSGALWNLPTGQRGESAFAVPSLFLNMEVPLREGNQLQFTLEGSEIKPSSEEKFDIKVREAYLNLVSVFRGMHVLRAGLIPQVWQEAQYEESSYRFVGQDMWSITEKWRYLDPADLGVSFLSEFAEGQGEWIVSFVNGNGAYREKAGQHKETSLFVRWGHANPWNFSVQYVRGNYEKYEEAASLKERIQALVVYRSPGLWRMSLEYLEAVDAADAISDLEMAEGVDASTWSGESVRGRGASLFLAVGTGPQAEWIVRYDYLNPVVEDGGVAVQTMVTGCGYRVSEDIRTAILFDYTLYGDDYGPGIRDRSKLTLAAQIAF